MENKLSDLSREALWALFPIFLVAYRDAWKANYAEVEALLRDRLPPAACISHIGSTAVDGIWAKDIVDVLVELPSGLEAAATALERSGFVRMSEEENRISLNLGYTRRGFAEKVFHVHLRHFGDNDELYFRDYLNAHPEVARDYEAMKLRLWKQYEHNRDAYTEAKTAFIRKWTAEARRAYAGRYAREECGNET